MPGTLSNLAGKLLLKGYQAVLATWPLICSVTQCADFKQHTRYRLAESGDFQQVGPTGELTHGTLAEQAYTQQVNTYGKMLAITRTDILNDDLGAFAKLPQELGRLGALALERNVYTLLMSNANNFFSTANKNYMSGANTNLQLSALQQAEQMMLDAVDDAGRPVMLQAVTLLVPTALKTTAWQLTNSTELVGSSTVDKPVPSGNPFLKRLEPAASPWLNNSTITGYSPTAWYLFGAPFDVAAIEVAFLNGRSSPWIETSNAEFNVLGIQMRAVFDFGVAMQDYRGAVMSKGAA
jgi:hypothetical protein